VDFALARDDVDPDRVALIGWSLGGHPAPRAAAGEHRLAACIADCGAFDMYAGFLARLGPLADSYEKGGRMATSAVREMLEHMAKSPTGGWALRRGMLVHGVDSPLDYAEAMRGYSLVGHAEHIRCPTWVCSAEGDAISASAPQLVAALTCPHEYVEFTAAEGAGDHCEAGARTLYHARSFGWLDALLEPARVG
jgi:predicted dienelactone hydrolase